MNYVKQLSIALLVICAVPAAFGVDKDTTLKGFEADGKFYPESAVKVWTDPKAKDVKKYYVISDECVQVETDTEKAVEFKKDAAGVIKNAAGNVVDLGKTAKYAVKDLNDEAINSFGLKATRFWHARGDYSQYALKGLALVSPVLLGAAICQLSPAARKKAQELYAKIAKTFSDAKEDNTARLKVGAGVLAAAGLAYGVYAKGNDAFYCVTGIDPVMHDGYKVAAA